MAHKKAGGSVRNGRDSQGPNVGLGKDDTLFAKQDGVVSFVTRGKNNRKFVEIVASEQ